jgi:hypothetical protein
MKILPPLLALATLSACVNYNMTERDALPHAKLDQAVGIYDFDLTPLQVVEDSRCPTGVQCVWEGRVRLNVRIDYDDRVVMRELILGEAQPVGTGMLKLVEATPYPREGVTIYPEEYKFGFTYTPNIAQ